ncbi:hypothetical protein JCM10212_002222 [Sporobolomyces blumeae]
MSAVARAIASEEPGQLDRSRLDRDANAADKGTDHDSARRTATITPSTSVEDLACTAHDRGARGGGPTPEHGTKGAPTFTPPPRKDSIGAQSMDAARKSPVSSLRSHSGPPSSQVVTSSVDATRRHNDTSTLTSYRPPPPVVDPSRMSEPTPANGSPIPQRLMSRSTATSAQSSPRPSSIPSVPASTAAPSPSGSGFQPSTRDTSSNTLSAQSTLSGVTSNSSHLPVPNTSPYPASTSSFSSNPEVTAALIQQLYARLDAQGVRGDGWDAGRERTRDGIINREAALGPEAEEASEVVRRKDPVGLSQDEEAKADSVLRRVDRYGFFSQSHPSAVACQHNRLATLEPDAFQNLPTLSGSTPKKAPRKSTSSTPPVASAMARNHPNRQSTVSLLPSSAIAPEQAEKETKRIAKWADMLTVGKRDPGGNAQVWTVASASWWSGRTPGGGGGERGKYRKFQRRVFKGVPDRWRRAVWGLLMEKMVSEVGQRGKPTLEQLRDEYARYLELPSTQDVQIDLDVPRTISGHVLFHTRYGQGQRALFHVLHAFGLRSENVGGYCQGMGPIAATLLCYFEPERAYAGLCRLFDQYELEHIFEPGFPGLMEAFYVQERLVESLMPDVHKAFNDQFISTSAFATKWYITLFANSVPFATQVRLWDGLLLDGLDFLIVTAVAIIWHFQHDFTSPTASFESILSTLSSYFFVESDDALLRWIRKTLRLKGLRAKMRAWRTEWKGFVRDGSSGTRVT